MGRRLERMRERVCVCCVLLVETMVYIYRCVCVCVCSMGCLLQVQPVQFEMSDLQADDAPGGHLLSHMCLCAGPLLYVREENSGHHALCDERGKLICEGFKHQAQIEWVVVWYGLFCFAFSFLLSFQGGTYHNAKKKKKKEEKREEEEEEAVVSWTRMGLGAVREIQGHKLKWW